MTCNDDENKIKDWKVQLNFDVSLPTRQAVSMLATAMGKNMKEVGEEILLNDVRVQKMLEVINEKQCEARLTGCANGCSNQEEI
jgi:hypothetical protein